MPHIYPTIILVKNPHMHHLKVLYGNTPNLHAKYINKRKIISDFSCHYMSDFGLYDIRKMIELGSYNYIFKQYPTEAVMSLRSFINGKKIPWMNTKPFKNKIMKLTKQTAHMCHDRTPQFAKDLKALRNSGHLDWNQLRRLTRHA